MQITVMVAVFLALMAGASVAGEEVVPGWLGYFDWKATLAMVGGTTLLMWSVLRVVSRWALGRLERAGARGRANLRLGGRVDLMMRIMVLTTFAVQLTLGGWAKLVCIDGRLNRLVLVDEVGLLLPFIGMLLMQWYCFYPINRFVKEYLVAGQLVEGLAARPVWRRREYMSFNVRHGLLIMLAPMMLILGLNDVVDLVKRRWLGDEPWVAPVSEVVVLAGAMVIFVLAPLLLRHIWLTRTLPAGPLRERLEEFCGKLRLKYRDILLWDTYSAVANAAVMGVVGRVRFLLLSDALIENMGDEEIEAVFAHEAGHVRHHHILFLVMFVIGGSLVILLLSALMEYGWRALTQGREAWVGYVEWFPPVFALALLGGGATLFGWVSRRFERQADVHAALSFDSDVVPETQDNFETNMLGTRGVRIMGSALLRIALLNGISADARSWRHSSIASRVALLRRLSVEEEGLKRFGRVVVLTKAAIVMALVVGIAGIGLLWWMNI